VVGERDSEHYFNSREEEINKRVKYLIFKARQALPSAELKSAKRFRLLRTTLFSEVKYGAGSWRMRHKPSGKCVSYPVEMVVHVLRETDSLSLPKYMNNHLNWIRNTFAGWFVCHICALFTLIPQPCILSTVSYTCCAHCEDRSLGHRRQRFVQKSSGS
jgi:hypothetical protein